MTAVVIAVSNEQPRVLTVGAASPRLPAGPLDPSAPRSDGLAPLGGRTTDVDRCVDNCIRSATPDAAVAPLRELAVAYWLVGEAPVAGAAAWRDLYEFLPGRTAAIRRVRLTAALAPWLAAVSARAPVREAQPGVWWRRGDGTSNAAWALSSSSGGPCRARGVRIAGTAMAPTIAGSRSGWAGSGQLRYRPVASVAASGFTWCAATWWKHSPKCACARATAACWIAGGGGRGSAPQRHRRTARRVAPLPA
jgi:hypothetical protein